MKRLLLIGISVSCFLVPERASADLLYLEDFGVAAERSSLFIRFHLAGGPDGKLSMQVQFGEGLSMLTTKIRIPPIEDPKTFQAAMEKLLATINNPKNTYLNLGVAMQEAGWNLAK